MLSVLRTSQVGHTLRVHLELVTLQMFADEGQQRVQDSHCPGYGGGGWVSVAWTHSRPSELRLISEENIFIKDRQQLLYL